MSVVVGLLLLEAAVLAHELGHLLGAAVFGVPVRKLLLGFGPEVFRRGRLSVKALPLGGGVDLEDESWESLPPQRKAVVCLLGPFSSIAAAYLALWLAMCLSGAGGAARADALFIDAAGTVVRAFSGGSGSEGLVGPVGFFAYLGSLAAVDAPTWLCMFSGVSLCAGLFSLVPLPPLDGGRAVFCFLPASCRRVRAAEKLGLSLLGVLAAVLLIRDVLALF